MSRPSRSMPPLLGRVRRSVMLAALLCAALPGCGEDSPTGAVAGAGQDAARVALNEVGPGGTAFREAFGRSHGRVRIVALVSPT